MPAYVPDKPGIYRGLPFADYRAIDAINWSTLKWCSRTMRHYKWHRDVGDSEDTDSQGLGRLFHSVLLEPKKVQTQYVTKPPEYPVLEKVGEFDGSVAAVGDCGTTYRVARGRGKARETWQAELVSDGEEGWSVRTESPDGLSALSLKPWNKAAKFCAAWEGVQEAAGREIVTRHDLKAARLMAASVHEIPQAALMLDGAETEVTIVWRDPIADLLCKGRIDVLKGGQLADAKSSSRSLEWETFARALDRWQYAGQAAFYRDGLNVLLGPDNVPEVPMFRFLCAESEGPYAAAVYDLFDSPSGNGSQDWLIHGRQCYRRYLHEVAWAEKHGVWTTYNQLDVKQPADAMEMGVPDWIKLDLGGTM